MARLSFSMMASLDGFVSDLDGGFDWGQIDDAVHRHANTEARRLSLLIHGRRMYETMVFWETYHGDTPVEAEFARLWRSVEKVVVSTSLSTVSSERTRLVRSLDIGDMQALRAETEGEIAVSGPELAGGFLDAGFIDEIGIYSIPVVIGAGRPMFRNTVPLKLDLVETTAFDNGVTFARYHVRASGPGSLA